MKKHRVFLFGPRVLAAVLCAVLFSFSCSGIVRAEGAAEPDTKVGLFPASSWVADKTYPDKAAHKLGFGFLNISTGWMALFYETLRGKYFFDGLAKGAFYTLTNTAGGILHAVTFPVPVDIPLLHGGIVYEYNR